MNAQFQRGDILRAKETRVLTSTTPGINYLVISIPDPSSPGKIYGLIELRSQGNSNSPNFPSQWQFTTDQNRVEMPRNYDKAGHIDLGDRENLIGKTLLEQVPELREFYLNPNDFE